MALAECARLIAPLGPYERAPVVAVAVSGGADSMALCLLVAAWAGRRRGRAVALTLDHGLRSGSRGEARQVHAWLTARGIEHHVLSWRGAKPRRGVQAAARAARYELLTRWCRRHRVLHLFLAHHLEDQAETLLLRLGRGSGVDGLAAMARVSERAGVRLLRPLLGVPKERLKATLVARGQDWVEDPANKDPAHLRTRVRGVMPLLEPVGLSPARLAATARRLGRARAALEAATGDLLAAAVTIEPAGYCLIDPLRLASAPSEIGLRGLRRVLMCVAGAEYPPRMDRLERLYEALASTGAGSARTLAGCRVVPLSDQVLVCREPVAAAEVLPLRPGGRGRWDGRFAVRLAPGGAGRSRSMSVRRLSRAGWAEVVSRDPDVRETSIPVAARASLPSLWGVDGVVSVPHLGFRVRGAPSGKEFSLTALFQPRYPLSPADFAAM